MELPKYVANTRPATISSPKKMPPPQTSLEIVRYVERKTSELLQQEDRPLEHYEIESIKAEAALNILSASCRFRWKSA